MLEGIITPKLSSQIITFVLRRRGWTVARVARALGASTDHVRQVHERKQTLQPDDLEKLARACKLETYRLVFDSLQRDRLGPRMQALYDLTREEIVSHQRFRRALMRRPSKKRGSSTKAA